jgi:ubiquinone/menaquinone biosynthesis C-methylase UbiE
LQEVLSHTKKAFNKAAPNYDEEERVNPILGWMRGVVRGIYLRSFKAGDRLLELNAGTGLDAMFLAGKGIEVLATDLSENMISIIESKARIEKAENMIKACVCPFDRIGEIESGNFDGVISNFGGLNCINDFDKLSSDLSDKLIAGGKFVAVVMNKFCPWEIFYYMMKFMFKNAFRRFHEAGVDANLHGEKVRTYYFTPGAFAAGFSKHFKVRRIYALGLYTPPPYLVAIYRKLRPVAKLLMAIDNVIKGVFPFNRFGDHFIIVMEKKQSA